MTRLSRFVFPSLAIALVCFVFVPVTQSEPQEGGSNEMMAKVSALPWKQSPNDGTIAGIASIKLERDYQFLGSSGTKDFLQLTGNLPNDNTYTLAKTNLDWFSVFRFDHSGYVKDDEKIEPDVLLEQLQKNNAASNEQRSRQGLPLLYLEGWFIPPRYDARTNRLEWGTRIRDQNGNQIVNFTTRLLGRSGVMQATLVSDPENLEHDVVEFKSALKNFTFNPGEKYSEFKQGDKVAEYGLAALVVGGAAAAAAKSGAGKAIFKGLGLLIIGGLAAMGALFKKVFGRSQ